MHLLYFLRNEDFINEYKGTKFPSKKETFALLFPFQKETFFSFDVLDSKNNDMRYNF